MIEKRLMKNREKRLRKEMNHSLRSLWNNIKRFNIHIITVPKMRGEINSQKEFEERIAEDLPKMVKDINLHIQEAHQTP